MRWFTCTPVAFGGGADFFARDSGLLCRGFQAIGVESQAVMPGPGGPDDEADLIRADYANLESAGWWESQRLDGVVLYAWGSPRYRNVAKAIRRSGTKLVLNQDSSGAISPLCGLRVWADEQRVMAGGGKTPGSALSALKRIARGLTVGLLVTDPLRAVHLRQGGWISCVHPAAADHYRRLCRIYGGSDLARRVVVAPHPVSPEMRSNGNPAEKRRQVVAVGRWDDAIQKRPGLLMEALGLLLSGDRTVRIEIVGKVTPALEEWRSRLPGFASERVKLRGKLPHPELRPILAASRVIYCPSAFESFHIAAAEALCCGCSVVAADLPTLSSLRWFASRNSGSLAETDDAKGHAAALVAELAEWDGGRRDPVAISREWGDILHADRVAAEILRFSSSP